MVIILIVYSIVMVVTYEMADFALWRVRLYEGERFESSEKECKLAALAAGVFWPVTIFKISQLNREINEIEMWR